MQQTATFGVSSYNKELACIFGIPKALLIHSIAESMHFCEDTHNGLECDKGPFESFVREFPELSEDTIREALGELVDSKLLFFERLDEDYGSGEDIYAWWLDLDAIEKCTIPVTGGVKL